MAARFNLEWISKEEYKDWLLPEDSDNTKARCKLCRKTFSLSNMGEPSLKNMHKERSIRVSYREVRRIPQ